MLLRAFCYAIFFKHENIIAFFDTLCRATLFKCSFITRRLSPPIPLFIAVISMSFFLLWRRNYKKYDHFALSTFKNEQAIGAFSP